MKSFSLSLVTVLAMGTFAVAGGDIAPVVEPVVEVVAPVADVSGFYIGGAYSMANAQNDFEWYDDREQEDGYGTHEVDYDAIMLQAGYQFNKYFAVEGRYWTSVTDGEYSFEEDSSGDGGYEEGSGDDNSDEFTAWGIYVKPMLPLTDAFTVYGLLGYGNVTLSSDETLDWHEGNDWLDESGFQWGAGASYAVSDNLSLFVDYVELYNDETSEDEEIGEEAYRGYQEDIKVYTVNFGLTYKF